MSKKIKILKDIPGFKAGTVFVQVEATGSWYPEGESSSYSYLEELFNGIGQFDGWFEEVKEKPKTFNTYYIRSNGEIVGPNKVSSLGHKLQLRRDFGNLFYSRKEAEQAQKLMKQFLTIYNETKHYPYIKIHVEGRSCEF